MKKNRLLATIRKMEKQYSVQVEFMVTESFPINGWYNIFHATISGNSDVYGCRIPGIVIKYTNGNMFIHISSAINGNMDFSYDTPITPVPLNKWITINVSQTKVNDAYHYKIEMDGELVYTVENRQPREFQNVKIYISNPWIPAVPGYVRNVHIKGKV